MKRQTYLAQITERIAHILDDRKDASEGFSDLIKTSSPKLLIPLLIEKIPHIPTNRLFNLAEGFSRQTPSRSLLRCIRQLKDTGRFLLAGFLSAAHPEIARAFQEHLHALLSEEQIVVLAEIKSGRLSITMEPLLLMPEAMIPVLTFWLSERLSKIPAERQKIVKLLGRLGQKDNSVIPHLVGCFNDESPQLQIAAAVALSSLAPASIPYLQKAMGDKTASVRIGVLRAIRKIEIQRESVIPYAVNALSDGEIQVRKSAAVTLVKMGEAVIPELVKSLPRMFEPHAIVTGIRILRKLEKSSQQVISCLLLLSNHVEPAVRIAVLKAFEKIKTPQSQAVILAALEDPIEAVQVAGISAVEKSSYPIESAMEILFSRARSESQQIREAVAKALGKADKNQEHALQKLMELLSDESVPVRIAAIKATGCWKAKANKVLGNLLPFLNGDDSLALAALEAIGEMGEDAKDALPQVLNLVVWENPILAARAIKTLGTLGAIALNPLMRLVENSPTPFHKSLENAFVQIGSQAIPALMEALIEGSQIKRKLATQTLSRMGEAAVSPLLKGLQHEDFWVRKAATRALQEIGKPSVLPLMEVIRRQGGSARESAYHILKHLKGKSLPSLLCAIADSKPELAQFALKIFEKIGPEYEEAIPELIALMHHHSQPLIRQVAIAALAKIGNKSPEVLKALNRAKDDPNPEVRKTSQQAIWELKGEVEDE